MKNSDMMEIWCLGAVSVRGGRDGRRVAQLAQAVPEPDAHLKEKPGLLQEQGLTAIFSVAIGLQIVHDLTDQEVFWLQ